MLNRIIAFSIRRRVFVLAAAALVGALGLYAALKLPVDVLPDLARPTVAVMAEAPGLTPEDIESQITSPLETALSGTPQSTTVRSLSGDGFALVYAEFSWNSNRWRNRQAVQERLDQLSARLPAAVKAGMLPDSSIMGEIVLFALTPGNADDEHLMDLRNYVDWTLRQRLLSIRGVAQVSAIGGRKRQWQVRADMQAMRDHNVTFEELFQALRQADGSRSGGPVVVQDREIGIAANGKLRSIDDISNSLVKINNGTPVKVSAVASVIAAPQMPRGDAALNGKPAIIIAVQKQPGADTREVTRAVEKILDDARLDLPDGTLVEQNVFRQAEYVASGIGNVSESVLLGSILTGLVLVLFLGRIRPAIVTLTAIPFSLLATAAVFKLFGQTINCMTLGGIAIAIGELADDAIVDVENIQRRLAQNRENGNPQTYLEVVYSASTEIRSSIIYGTLTVVLALLPLFFLSGIDGRLFVPLAGAYVTSIFMSMLIALTVTPALSSWLFKTPQPQADAAPLRACKSIARSFYRISMPRPGMVLLILLVALAGSWLLAGRLGRNYLPALNESTLTVRVKSWPEVTLAESSRLVGQIEEALLAIPEVRLVARRTGRAELDEHAEGLNSSELDVAFWNSNADEKVAGRSRPSMLRDRAVVVAEVQEKLRQFQGVSIAVGRPISHRIDHLLSGVTAPVVLKIHGGDLATLRRLSARAEAALRRIDGVVQIQTDRPGFVTRVRIRPNRDALANYGFTATEFNDVVQTALSGRTVVPAVSKEQPHDVVLWSEESLRRNPEALCELPLLSPSGAHIRLCDAADIREAEGAVEIRRENGIRQVTVACNVLGRDLGSAVDEIERDAGQALTPALQPGYSFQFSGEFEARREAARFLIPLSALTLIIAAVLLYNALNSAAATALLLLNIPLAFIGGILALSIAQEPLSLASLVGFITLAGIACRNGVLLFSHYIHLMKREGLPLSKETIIRGSQERVAPVSMTALTTGIALLPLILSRGQPGKEFLFPVAVVVIGGLIVTTLLDFAVMPALFLKFYRAPKLKDTHDKPGAPSGVTVAPEFVPEREN